MKQLILMIFAKLFMFTAILIFPLTIFCQKDYHSGYIITNDNDTLHGMIRDRKEQPFGKIYDKIRFRDKSIFPEKFNPDQINGYRVGDTDYESLWLNISSSFFREYYSSMAGSGREDS